MTFWTDKKVVVTGGAGFIGRHIVEILRTKQCKDIVVPRRLDCDLTKFENCLLVTNDADIVIHGAALVGGIEFNQRYPADVYYINLLMNTLMLESARINNVKKFVSISSACAYPLNAPVPLKEEDLMGGEPEPTNAPYGFAKRMMVVHTRVLRQQYGMNCVVVIPFNAFGPWDNYDPRSSHVIPALIKKCFEEDELVVWGDGTPTRNFLYVEDFAMGVVLAAEKLEGSEPVNIGTEEETSIKEAVDVIVRHTGFKGKIRFDKTKPNGQPKRAALIEKAREILGYKPKYTFEEGIKKTVDWYRETILKST